MHTKRSTEKSFQISYDHKSESISMPPSVAATTAGSDIMTLNVGGQIFQTTKQTLALAGSQSLLSHLAGPSPFLDRDPDLFSLLLSLLRTGSIPSNLRLFGLHDLLLESRFYGLEQLLVNSLSDPTQFDAFALRRSILLPLSGRDSPSAAAATRYGSLHVAHGSRITSFDWSLRRKSTVLTNFTAIDSLLPISPNLAAAGATDFAGLQIIDLENGYLKEVLQWENSTKSGSTVQGIGSSTDFIFTSFESARRNSNSIMVYDINSLNPVSEIGHHEIYGADLTFAIPATKLSWVPSYGLLMASGSHSGLSGVIGTIKFYDVRSQYPVFELEETVDCFADVCVSDSLNSIFKVGVNSGDVYYSDLRKLAASNGCTTNYPWTCLGEGRKVIMNGKREGLGCKIESHGNQVLCSRGGDMEVWSEVVMSKRSNERVFRRNLLGRGGKSGGSITNLAFGGNKMFVIRKEQQGVEVWQGSSRALL